MPESLRIQLGLPPVPPRGRVQFLAPKADTDRSVEKPHGAFPREFSSPSGDFLLILQNQACTLLPPGSLP